MKLSLILSALAVAVQADYSGDIVQYWVDQSTLIVNSTAIGGLPSPAAAWFPAIVHGAVYLAALQTEAQPRSHQQVAVSHAAHDALAWTFHGARVAAVIDDALRRVIPVIGLSPDEEEYQRSAEIGQNAAARVTAARSDDGTNEFVDYVVQPAEPGVYQPTPGGRALPDTPNARFVRPFGGIGDIEQFRIPAPPSATAPGYDQWVLEILEIGNLTSEARTAEQTEIAYFWLESSVAGWNRFAHAIVGSSLADDVVGSAKFYAQFNYALANAAIGAWDNKFLHNHWRPVTAILRPDTWLASNQSVYDPSFVPLLRPTPSHQDYPSTHATFGGAAAAVLKYFNGGDSINAGFSSNVTLAEAHRQGMPKGFFQAKSQYYAKNYHNDPFAQSILPFLERSLCHCPTPKWSSNGQFDCRGMCSQSSSLDVLSAVGR
jgi:hypothetical protein